jgi:predicted transcriptional regulator
MSKDAVFTMKLEAQLRDAFLAEAQAAHRPASQIVRDMMRDYVQRQRDEREHDAFIRAKVEAGRRDRLAGAGVSNDEVEAEFAARRLALEGKADEART